MGKLKEVDNLGRSKYKGSSAEILVEILVDFHIYIYIYIYKKKKLVLIESKRWDCYTYPSSFCLWGVKYPTWISNIVPVKKKNGQIHVCVDFWDLNNACPKDDFLLPIIEIMVDATTSHGRLTFMDGSFGYNQIRMAPVDEEKTTFRISKGIYCYKVMPFGLKNAGATY